MSENRNNLEDTGTLPYYLDLPDGQLMIGSKVVGTVGWTRSLSLITKEKKKASWTVCHFISMGKTKSKRKAYYRTTVYCSLSLSLFLFILY